MVTYREILNRHGGVSKVPREVVKNTRIRAKLTQEQAALLLGVQSQTWGAWETGRNNMHPCFMELFKIKTEQHEKYGLMSDELI